MEEADGTSGPGSTHGSGEALSELEQAIRVALASATPEQVLHTVAAALPGDMVTSSQPVVIDSDRFHGHVQKVSVSMPEELTIAIRERTGPGGFSRFVAEAADKRLRGELLDEYLDELDRVYGPIPQELLDQAEREWPDHEE